MHHQTDSGLVAVYREASRARIERELRAIDHRLFLDPEFSPQTGVFWTVKFWNGERATEPVVVIVDWRDERGNAKELSDGLVYDVQRIYRKGELDMKAIHKGNADLRERRAETMEERYREQAIASVQALRSKPVFHRSQSLRVARDRARRRGENV